MKISIIVAMGKDNAIGANNVLLCRLSDDLKRFKKITSGHTIIMGRKTFESLPHGALPERRNIVVSRNLKEEKGFEVARGVEEAISLCAQNERIYIIGGGELYEQFLPLCQEIHLTLIDGVFSHADTYFPTLNMEEWFISESDYIGADAKNEFPSQYYHLIRR